MVMALYRSVTVCQPCMRLSPTHGRSGLLGPLPAAIASALALCAWCVIIATEGRKAGEA